MMTQVRATRLSPGAPPVRRRSDHDPPQEATDDALRPADPRALPAPTTASATTSARAITGEYLALRDDPRVVDGARLQPIETATTVRVHDGETLVADGPFADTKEVFGGYYVLDAADLDGAIEIAARIPAARLGGCVEIRPLVEYAALIDEVFREEWGRVLASLIGFLGDFDLAEEAAQDAFAIAAERWPCDGAPANPGAWLVTTARNRAVDRIRRERTLAAKTRLLEVPEAVEDVAASRPRSPTSAWSSSSPAAIPRWRSRRRSR